MDSREWGQWIDEYPVLQGEAEHTTGPRNLRKRNMGLLALRYEEQSFSFIQTENFERDLPSELRSREGKIPSLGHIRK